MRLLIILLFSIPASAGNWVAGSKLKSTLPADGPTWEKSLCETRHSEKCYDRTGKDPRHFKIVNEKMIADIAGKAAADLADQAKLNIEIAKKNRLDALRAVLRIRRDNPVTPQGDKDILEYILGE